MSSSPHVSVIIPAHNEASVIFRCLKSVREACSGQMPETIVVANNCSDDTAQKAREFDPMVKVIETPIGSKVHALNLGDEAATGYPRVYLDADIALEKDSMVKLCQELEKPGILAVAPLIDVDLTDRPWTVRAFYGIWQQLPYCRTGMIGSGIYVLSEEGRQRFDTFPKITADDAFARLHFKPSERRTVESCRFTVTPPKTLSSIIDIKTRAHYGNAELKQQFPDLWKNEEANHGRPLLGFAINPLRWPALVVYVYVKLATRKRVRERFERGEVHKWERDESSREVSKTETES